jgi:hypothetical protein
MVIQHLRQMIAGTEQGSAKALLQLRDFTAQLRRLTDKDIHKLVEQAAKKEVRS